MQKSNGTELPPPKPDSLPQRVNTSATSKRLPRSIRVGSHGPSPHLPTLSSLHNAQNMSRVEYLQTIETLPLQLPLGCRHSLPCFADGCSPGVRPHGTSIVPTSKPSTSCVWYERVLRRFRRLDSSSCSPVSHGQSIQPYDRDIHDKRSDFRK